MKNTCPLCRSPDTSMFHAGDRASGYRDFLRCDVCDLVFVPEKFLPGGEDEKERYLEHNNDPHDGGYRDFLNRLYRELKPRLKRGAKGLDYGAGPGPALAEMMREDGFDMRIFDPYFHQDESVLRDTYDFITCTETVEHFHHPAREFENLDGMLKRTGWLGVMTGMLEDWSEFPSWYYRRDPTHVCFYSRRAMIWIAQRFSWEPLFPRQNVVLFHKS